MTHPHNTFSSDKSQTIISTIITNTLRMSKRTGDFVSHVLSLFLMLRGRRNFTNAARYGFHKESVYRWAFARRFDWLALNTALVREHTSARRIIAFDPSFLPKSRNRTAHVGTFWSGTSGKALHGLEIGSLAVIDLEKNTALHLEAVQTPNTTELKAQGKTLTDHYAALIVERKATLERLSKYLVVDGYFGKRKFFDGILGHTNLQIVTKLRNDADLRYLYTGAQKKGSGRPKRFDGKVNWTNLPDARWEKTEYDERTRLLTALLWSPTLRRIVRLVVVEEIKEGMPIRYAVLCSTDTTLGAREIFEHYTKRYQIEFLFRDAKQYAGLTHCQARSERKLHFHFNASLTAVSVAKVAHFFDVPVPNARTYSLADVGMAYFNEFFANFFFSRLDIDAESEKITSALPSLLSFGLIHSG
jgi:hypothetical protein